MIFASLLITVVTVSFMRIMLQTAQEASTVDLSQSAYDAALDGVEDAKRAIVDNRTQLGGTNCNQVAQALGNGNGEVIIRQDVGDEALSMAYTCVTVNFDADDYVEDNISENNSTLIPLQTADGSDFEEIRVKWRREGGPHAVGATLRNITEVAGQDNILPQRASWDANTPALLRVRYIWAGPSFDLNAHYNSVDGNEFEAAGRSRTMFFYPVSDGSTSNASIATTNMTRPAIVNCSGTADHDCTVTLTSLPGASNATKYIQITPLYAATDINLELLDGSGNIVPFSDVQAVVDSTGRASDVFRRVQARVRLDGASGSISYPSDALTINDGNLCKDFSVTDDPDDYRNNCTP